MRLLCKYSTVNSQLGQLITSGVFVALQCVPPLPHHDGVHPAA
jgi:hypothetical protein